ncbi:hypothetical protein M0Q03_03595 [bacterium]|jgi:hypothetical protein|nr:hypothetical protein [bacterium]
MEFIDYFLIGLISFLGLLWIFSYLSWRGSQGKLISLIIDEIETMSENELVSLLEELSKKTNKIKTKKYDK